MDTSRSMTPNPMTDYRRLATCLSAAGIILLICGCAVTPVHLGVNVVALEETRGFDASSMFNFTLSPDDRWVVYYEQVPRDYDRSVYGSSSLLRVLDIETRTVHRFTLPRDHSRGGSSRRGHWSPDSKYCLLPARQARGMLLDVRDPENVTLTKVFTAREDRRRAHDSRIILHDAEGKFVADLPHELTCSDCIDLTGLNEFLREHIPEEHYRGGSAPLRGLNHQAISADRRFVYYTQGERSERVSILERDVDTRKERTLATHRGEPVFLHPFVDATRLRLSPNGRWLAYRVQPHGSKWVGRSRLYLIDLKTGRRRLLRYNVFNEMHWTSDSSRLYFYHRHGDDIHQQRLHYVRVQ